MSAPAAFERLTKAGVVFLIRDHQVFAKYADSMDGNLLMEIDRHREEFRNAVSHAAKAIQNAKAKEVRT